MFERRPHSIFLVAGLLAGAVVVLAAVNLGYLRKLHRRSLHSAATQSVIDLGRELARNLANQPAVQSAGDDPRRWADFSRIVRSLKRVEPSLDSVVVNEGDVTVYHEDTQPGPEGTAGERRVPDVRVERSTLALGRGQVHVLTFSAPVPDVAGPGRAVEVVMREDAVQQREEQAAAMLGVMFRLALVTLGVALVLGAVLGVWVVRHEMAWQRRRRDEEHLAFAGLLADGIIHDVRNPMSSLRLDIQMLQKEAEKAAEARPARLVELATRARATMDRMDHVMREFLYVSKPGPREPECFDVNSCARDCLDLLGPRFERAGIVLEARLEAGPIHVMGSSVGLKRAIINVLTNARQVSAAGTRVVLASRREGAHAILTVEDEGPGIRKEELSRIFEVFVSGRPGGLGLGLYLAKAAVEGCGGTITGENRPAGGARFTIRLPHHPASTHPEI